MFDSVQRYPESRVLHITRRFAWVMLFRVREKYDSAGKPWTTRSHFVHVVCLSHIQKELISILRGTALAHEPWTGCAQGGINLQFQKQTPFNLDASMGAGIWGLCIHTWISNQHSQKAYEQNVTSYHGTDLVLGCVHGLRVPIAYNNMYVYMTVMRMDAQASTYIQQQIYTHPEQSV